MQEEDTLMIPTSRVIPQLRAVRISTVVRKPKHLRTPSENPSRCSNENTRNLAEYNEESGRFPRSHQGERNSLHQMALPTRRAMTKSPPT